MTMTLSKDALAAKMKETLLALTPKQQEEFLEEFAAVMVKNLDWPGADEIEKRLKPLLKDNPAGASYGKSGGGQMP